MTVYLIKKDEADERSSSYFVVAELMLSMGDLRSLLKDPNLPISRIKTVDDFEGQMWACHCAYSDRSRKSMFSKADIEKDQDSRQKV